MVKDFNHFYNRGLPVDLEKDPLNANLFNLEGSEWRNMRLKISPTFTTGKLKGMLEQLCACGDKLIKHIGEVSAAGQPVHSKPIISSFSFEVIASIAFGLQLDKDSEANKAFGTVVKKVFSPSTTQFFRIFLVMFFPRVARILGVKQFPKDVEDLVFFLTQNTLQYRRDNNVSRNDFLQLLMNIQKQELEGTQKDSVEESPDDDVIQQMQHATKGDDVKNKIFMTDTIITAQLFGFLSGGSESVSSIVNFTMFCLSQNQCIQERAREEIYSVLKKHENKWSYQAVKEMVYLQQIIEESLRMFPAIPLHFRMCTKTYRIPDTSIYIEKGTKVFIPVMAIQNDSLYYESPEVFNPDRFKDNNMKPRGTFNPFGDGPRICIALRFATLEIKVLIARMISEFKISLNSKTKLPMAFHKKSILLTPEHDLYFDFEKRVKC
uniref:Cytochrome P450 n=2 Tax=Clastoptera arizonana TaxID=38151 RepID=A0A1B6E5W4_9HEMI